MVAAYHLWRRQDFLLAHHAGGGFRAFPKGGAIAIGAMGGIGMLSAGLLGGPGIGYNQDYMASTKTSRKPPRRFMREYKSARQVNCCFSAEIHGWTVQSSWANSRSKAETRTPEGDVSPRCRSSRGPKALRRSIRSHSGHDGHSLSPARFLYFKSRGGYKAVHIDRNR